MATVTQDDTREGRAPAFWVGVVGNAIGIAALLATVPPLLVENPLIPAILAVVAIGCGLWAVRGGERFVGGYAIAAGVLGMVAALVVQNAQAETVDDIVNPLLFTGMLAYATPLAFASLGGLFSERSGVVNIGLEGMMLFGAFFGILICDKADSWWIGVLGAMAVGGVVSFVHAFFSITLRADQIVSGTAINILALGVTAYAFRSIYGSDGTPEIDRIPEVSVPGVSSIPYLGEVMGTVSIMVWLILVLCLATSLFLFRSPWGLRLRAVGEKPRAADTVGIRVIRTRYLAVTLSGMLAAMGGAYLSFGLLEAFNENMTAGRGFIALAALILGKWRPWGLLAATLLFGFAQSMGDALQTSANVPSDVVSLLPYVLTLVALVGLVGRSVPPGSVGIPYKRQ